MKLHQIVARNPDVHSGDLVFAGTRVPVRHLIAYLKGGDPLDVFLEHFPTVERCQAEAFLEHAVSETEEQLDRETHHAASDPA